MLSDLSGFVTGAAYSPSHSVRICSTDITGTNPDTDSTRMSSYFQKGTIFIYLMRIINLKPANPVLKYRIENI